MATMTIRGLDDSIKARLRIQAAMHGRSMEDEARDILRTALSQEQVAAPCLVTSIRAKIEAVGGVDLALPEREAIRDVVDLS
ncbi:MAG: plasmid stabilization protein [Acinetobacter sp.]|nr:plasmid stabilization protein [Acinetobacter sp.]